MSTLSKQLTLDRCPHCNVDTPSLEQVFSHNTKNHAGQNLRFWGIYQCARCGGLVIAAATQNNGKVKEVYPTSRIVDDAIPIKAKAFLEQALGSLHAPAGAILLAASAIDAMLKEKGYKEGHLSPRINRAAKDHLITEEMATWAHKVRLDANGQRHADDSLDLPTETEAQMTVEFALALFTSKGAKRIKQQIRLRQKRQVQHGKHNLQPHRIRQQRPYQSVDKRRQDGRRGAMTEINDNGWLMNLTDPPYAYLFGFIQADGHLRRGRGNKGHLMVELSAQDKEMLEKFAELVPFYSSVRVRTRTTNFKAAYESAVWQVSDLRFRRGLVALGVPEGRKSHIIAPPVGEFAQTDYYRGMIDADGALGFTAYGFPFVSLTTDSTAMAQGYLAFLTAITSKHKTIVRNTRDGVFNINVYKEEAQQLTATLYYNGCLALPRKLAKAQQVLCWVRPPAMKKIEGRKKWGADEDKFIVSHTIKEAMQALGRSEQSVSLRLWRLRSGQVSAANKSKGNEACR